MQVFFSMPPCYWGKDDCLETKTSRVKGTYTTFILKQVQKCTKILKRANKYDSHLITSKWFSLVQTDDSRGKKWDLNAHFQASGAHSTHQKHTHMHTHTSTHTHIRTHSINSITNSPHYLQSGPIRLTKYWDNSLFCQNNKPPIASLVWQNCLNF